MCIEVLVQADLTRSTCDVWSLDKTSQAVCEHTVWLIFVLLLSPNVMLNTHAKMDSSILRWPKSTMSRELLEHWGCHEQPVYTINCYRKIYNILFSSAIAGEFDLLFFCMFERNHYWSVWCNIETEQPKGLSSAVYTMNCCRKMGYHFVLCKSSAMVVEFDQTVLLSCLRESSANWLFLQQLLSLVVHSITVEVYVLQIHRQTAVIYKTLTKDCIKLKHH